jgi:hypothetical protein
MVVDDHQGKSSRVISKKLETKILSSWRQLWVHPVVTAIVSQEVATQHGVRRFGETSQIGSSSSQSSHSPSESGISIFSAKTRNIIILQSSDRSQTIGEPPDWQWAQQLGRK